ncbi:MAG: hypothetical protein IJS08_09425 [Victivallales bacterium]|nr:hypothetical protein [Victivallales bacterium]
MKRQSMKDVVLERLNGFLEGNGLPSARCENQEENMSATLVFSGGVRFTMLDATAMATARILDECALRGKGSTVAIAPFFPPSVAERLAEERINYVDTAGNLMLRIGGNVLCVKNCPRPAALTRKVTPGRCWNPQGLKVLFLLLTENEALSWTYRRVATECGVSLGTVNNVMKEALEQGYLLKWEKSLRFGDRGRMIDLWTANYAMLLLPRLEVTRYQGTPVSASGEVCLLAGGETAAAEAGLAQTNYGEYWRHGNIAQFVAKARWHIDDRGNIIVKEAFWPAERCFKGHVPWLLVYADLMSKDDSRCQEIAEEVRTKYLEDKQ